MYAVVGEKVRVVMERRVKSRQDQAVAISNRYRLSKDLLSYQSNRTVEAVTLQCLKNCLKVEKGKETGLEVETNSQQGPDH